MQTLFDSATAQGEPQKTRNIQPGVDLAVQHRGVKIEYHDQNGPTLATVFTDMPTLSLWVKIQAMP